MGIGGTADERSWESLQKRARNYARKSGKVGDVYKKYASETWDKKQQRKKDLEVVGTDTKQDRR